MMLILGRVARVLNRPVVLMSGHLSGEQADVSLLRRTTSGSACACCSTVHRPSHS